jgi:dihydrofolate reductase
MAKVLAGITTSIDGYITGPDDGPGKGLGEDGERLHNWVFGGPWRYADEVRPEPSGEDAAWLEEVTSRIGAVVGGRNTYEAARHWGGENPWGCRSSSSLTTPTSSLPAAASPLCPASPPRLSGRCTRPRARTST